MVKLHAACAHDALSCMVCIFTNVDVCGVTEVKGEDGRVMKLFIVLTGVKGDWVYLRI